MMHIKLSCVKTRDPRGCGIYDNEIQFMNNSGLLKFLTNGKLELMIKLFIRESSAIQ